MYYQLIDGCVGLTYLYSTPSYYYYYLLLFTTITPLVLFFSSLPFLSMIGLDCDSYAGAGIIRQVGRVLEHERLLFFFFSFFPPAVWDGCYSSLLLGGDFPVGKKKIMYDRISCHGLLGSWSAPMGAGVMVVQYTVPVSYSFLQRGINIIPGRRYHMFFYPGREGRKEKKVS